MMIVLLGMQVHVDRKTQPVQRLTFTRADKSAGSIKVTRNHLDIPLHSTAANVNACEYLQQYSTEPVVKYKHGFCT
jgi:hypothetical protein